MKKLLLCLFSFWLGGCAALFSYYAVWLAANPQCHMHWWTTQYFLLWPWYRAVDVFAWCL